MPLPFSDPFRLARLLTVAGLLAVPAARAQDPLSLSCAVCHGPRDAPSAVPSFYDHSTGRIDTLLREFRDGTRDGTAMPRLAKALSDADIQALACEYGTGPP